MYRMKMEFKMFWIAVLLIHSKVSGSAFYDSNNSARINSADSEGNNLHTPPVAVHDENDGDETGHNNNDKGLGQSEMNFLSKLTQRQRQQRQLIPAVKVPSESPSAGIDIDWLRFLAGLDLLDNEVYGSLNEDLSTLLRFLAQHKDEALTEDRGIAEEYFDPNGQKRAAALRMTMARRSHSFPTGGKERFSPSVSVGALTNLGDFFKNLKINLDSLESKNLSRDQVKLLEGDNMISNLRKEFIDDYPKPAGSAAFLNAIRHYRPSSRIRALVSSVPDLYRGTNLHNPVYLHAGLGK